MTESEGQPARPVVPPGPSADGPSADGPPLSVTLLLALSARRIGDRAEGELAGHSLTLRHLGALGHLSARPGLSITELAQRAGVRPPSMHATVRDLQRLGFLASPGQRQGKRAELVLTDGGRQALASGMAVIAESDASLRGRLGAGAYAELARALWRITRDA